MGTYENPRARARRAAQQYAELLSPDELAALEEAIRYEIVGALIEERAWLAAQRNEQENRHVTVAHLTEQLDALFKRRLVLERTLGAKPLHRRQLVAELHQNEQEYQQVKRLRHEILKGHRKPPQ